jgi:predicted nucleic acid-binding protein
MPAIVNASPLILLAKTGNLGLLHLAGDPVFVPRAVEQEILQGGPTDPATQALRHTNWLQVVDPGPDAPLLLPYRLDPGEAAVLTWALAHPGTMALLDDLAARRCAIALGIGHQGSAGLVVAAKQQSLIPLARPALEQLRRAGLYLSDTVMNQILVRVGE